VRCKVAVQCRCRSVFADRATRRGKWRSRRDSSRRHAQCELKPSIVKFHCSEEGKTAMTTTKGSDAPSRRSDRRVLLRKWLHHRNQRHLTERNYGRDARSSSHAIPPRSRQSCRTADPAWGGVHVIGILCTGACRIPTAGPAVGKLCWTAWESHVRRDVRLVP